MIETTKYSDRYEHYCTVCEERAKGTKPNWQHPCVSRGLGDTIAKVTDALGIKPCGGCGRRKRKLNRLFPY